MPPHRHAYRPVVMGTRGAVTSAHPLASMAGARMLLEGGNAVDAAVAVGATLNVVEPFMSSAGGIGLMLISRAKTRERHVLDFVGGAPLAADPTKATEDELAGGPKAFATPGNLGGWLAALERFGTMPRPRVLGSAIDYAEKGVPLTWMNATFFEKSRETLARSAEAQRLYLGNGGPRPGKIVTYKELAGTFRQVAEGGAEVFYGAHRQGHRARGAGGGRVAHRGGPGAVHAGVAPAHHDHLPRPRGVLGAAAVLRLPDARDAQHPGGLRRRAAGATTRPSYLHHLIEAIKLASADRLAYAYLNDVSKIPIAGLVSKAYAAAQRARIDPARAGVSEGERHTRRQLPGQIAEGHPGRVRARADHALRLRRRRGHGGLGDADARRALRLGLRRAGHRPRAQQHPQVDGPRSRLAQRGAAGQARRGP